VTFRRQDRGCRFSRDGAEAAAGDALAFHRLKLRHIELAVAVLVSSLKADCRARFGSTSARDRKPSPSRSSALIPSPGP